MSPPRPARLPSAVAILLAVLGLSFSAEARPLRVMVHIEEEVLIEGAGTSSTGVGRAESAVNAALIEAGFLVVDPETTARIVGIADGQGGVMRGFQKRKLHIDAAVFGEARVASAGAILETSMKSIQATINARVVEVDSERVLGEASADGRAIHISEVVGMQDALAKAGRAVAGSLAEHLKKADLRPQAPPETRIALNYNPRLRYASRGAVGDVDISGRIDHTSKVKEVEVNGVSSSLVPLEERGSYDYSARLSLTGKDSRILVSALDDRGSTVSRSFPIGAALSGSAPADPGKPRLWVLAVGLSEYLESGQNLKFADADARGIARVMERQGGKMFSEVKARVLLNREATRERVLESLDSFLGGASGNDVVMVFMAGHGIMDTTTGSYYFLAHDSRPDRLVATGLLWSSFDEALKRNRKNVASMVIWLDTCHSGAMKDEVKDGQELTKELSSGEGTYMLAASSPDEYSLESDVFRRPGGGGHGAFTFALLEGLEGGADTDEDGTVTIAEIFYYVSKEVPRLTGKSQHPYFRMAGRDLPIFLNN